MSAASTRITTAADLGQFIGGVCLDALMDDVLDPLEQALVRYIDEELVDADRRGEVDEETELLLDEYIDSINVVHLVIFIRERCGCEVPPEDITIDHFGTVRDLAGYLRRRGLSTPSSLAPGPRPTRPSVQARRRVAGPARRGVTRSPGAASRG